MKVFSFRCAGIKQTLNSYHVISIKDQRVIDLAPFFVESAYKKYTNCAMNVYLPILEDQSQNEGETAVHGCHWPRDSTVRMGRSAQVGERRPATRKTAGLKPGRTNIQGIQIMDRKVLNL